MVTLPCDTRVRLGNEAVELGASQVSTVSTVFCGVVGTIITLFYHRRKYNTVTLSDLPQAAQPQFEPELSVPSIPECFCHVQTQEQTVCGRVGALCVGARLTHTGWRPPQGAGSAPSPSSG